MNSTTIPGLRYRDAEGAIHWLCKTFGFEVFLKVGGEGGRIEHARLTLGDSMVMLASIGREGDFEKRFRSPAAVGGVTQSTLLVVADPDRIYKTARAAGANIVDELTDFEFGGRMFSCEDIESHLWVITSHDPWDKMW